MVIIIRLRRAAKLIGPAEIRPFHAISEDPWGKNTSIWVRSGAFDVRHLSGVANVEDGLAGVVDKLQLLLIRARRMSTGHVGRAFDLANYHWPVEVRELVASDASSVVALWSEVGLTRPWNDAASDFQRALDGATSAVLGIRQHNELIGTVMVGHDGHRGWVYYLAVGTAHQREGIGSALMSAAEAWLREMGAVKVQLMVRSENESVLTFYDRIGYETSDVSVLSRWLER